MTASTASKNIRVGNPAVREALAAGEYPSDQAWQIVLADQLGYPLWTPGHAFDLRTQTLAPDPFTIIGPLVFVRHCRVEADGSNRRSWPRFRFEVRLLPRTFKR